MTEIERSADANHYTYLKNCDISWINILEICNIANGWDLILYPWIFFVNPVLYKNLKSKIWLSWAQQREKLSELLEEKTIKKEQTDIVLTIYYKMCLSWFFWLKWWNCIKALKNLDSNDFLKIANIQDYKNFILLELWNKADELKNKDKKELLLRNFPQLKDMGFELKVDLPKEDIRIVLERSWWEISWNSVVARQLFQEVSQSNSSKLNFWEVTKLSQDLLLLEKNNFDINNCREIAFIICSSCLVLGGDHTYIHDNIQSILKRYSFTLGEFSITLDFLKSKQENWITFILNLFTPEELRAYGKQSGILSQFYNHCYSCAKFWICRKLSELNVINSEDDIIGQEFMLNKACSDYINRSYIGVLNFTDTLINSWKRRLAIDYIRSLSSKNEFYYNVYEKIFSAIVETQWWINCYNELIIDKKNNPKLAHLLDICIHNIVTDMVKFKWSVNLPDKQLINSYLEHHSRAWSILQPLLLGQLDNLKSIANSSSGMWLLEKWNSYISHMTENPKERKVFFMRALWIIYNDTLTLERLFWVVSDSSLSEMIRVLPQSGVNPKEVINEMLQFVPDISFEKIFVLYACMNPKYDPTAVDKIYDHHLKVCFTELLWTLDGCRRLIVLCSRSENIVIEGKDEWVEKAFLAVKNFWDINYALNLTQNFDFLEKYNDELRFESDKRALNFLQYNSDPLKMKWTKNLQDYFKKRISSTEFKLFKNAENREFLIKLYSSSKECKLEESFKKDIADMLKKFRENEGENLIPDDIYLSILEEYYPDSVSIVDILIRKWSSYQKRPRRERSNELESGDRYLYQYDWSRKRITTMDIEKRDFESAIGICDQALEMLQKRVSDEWIIQRIQDIENHKLQSINSRIGSENSRIIGHFTELGRSIAKLKGVAISTGATYTPWSSVAEKEILEYFKKAYVFATKYHIEVHKEYRLKNFKDLLGSWYDFAIITEHEPWIEEIKLLLASHQIRLPRSWVLANADAKKVEDKKNIENKLRDILSDSYNPQTIEIANLVALFGMSNAVDVLVSYNPEFGKLWNNLIISIISEYLGNFLLINHGFIYQEVPENLNLQSNDFETNFKTMIEKDFLVTYNSEKKTEPNNQIICDNYVANIKTKLQSMSDKNKVIQLMLFDIVDKFHDELNYICTMEKPDSFVDNLKEWREFPDFLQKLNAAEVKKKKRFLIADGMGMGKSLSALLSIEHIWADAKPCLITTPSNVISTWKGYLSEYNAETNTGYFKHSKRPNIKIISSTKELKNTNDLKNYDYVLVSHESLTAVDVSNDTQIRKSMIVDEVHKLKNIKSGKRAIALLEIAAWINQNDGYVCLLSGTPIPNKIKDIAILFMLLYPNEYIQKNPITNNLEFLVKPKDLENSILQWATNILRSKLLSVMQMKKLTEHVEMPPFTEEEVKLDLSEKENEYYSAILDDDQLTAAEKIPLLRKFLLNPQLLWIEDVEVSTKAKRIGDDSNKLFEKKKRIVYFVNGPISGVIRAHEESWITKDKTLIAQMGLKEDIKIKVIEWDTSPSDRVKIQSEFNNEDSDDKIALFVSGSIGDVGIDLTWGEHIIHINEPWTQADKDQQDARVYRYGQKKAITSTTYITNRSIEEWIHRYVKIKQDAILKLYYGIQLTEEEKDILKKDNLETDSPADNGKTINKWLTDYFQNSSKELNMMFGCLKEAGEVKAEELVAKRWEEFAGYYKDLWPRSYQANVNRMHAQIISSLIESTYKESSLENLRIVDLWSGPKMLQRQMKNELWRCVTSVDINPHHFTEEDITNGSVIISSFLDISKKVEQGKIDIVSCSLSFHDTYWKPKQEKEEWLERLLLLWQIYDILKVWWTALISLPYSLDFKDMFKLKELLKIIWFEIDFTRTGSATSNNFSCNTLCIRKLSKRWFWWKDIKDSLYSIKSYLEWLDISSTKKKLKNQKSVLQEFELNNKEYSIELNKDSKEIVVSEKSCKELIERLIDLYKKSDTDKSITYIPKETLIENGFWKYYNEKSCVLVKRLFKSDAMYTHRELLWWA